MVRSLEGSSSLGGGGIQEKEIWWDKQMAFPGKDAFDKQLLVSVFPLPTHACSSGS